MNRLKSKIILLVIFAITILFFSNDFGLIDIEKTAIITAIAIDKEDDQYTVTCQIAVPEASNQISENQKAQIEGKGKTVAGAIKNVGSVSGWFPQTIFCNLIILGNSISNDNVINTLDYFSTTLRVQDSAQVILAEDKAKDLLSATTPLDNISSFAIQKILLKNPGFDQDVCSVDVKTFCVEYYSQNASSYMPIVKVLKTEEENSNGDKNQQSSDQSSGTKTNGTKTFDATTTALFYKGKKVGELDKELSRTFNMLTRQSNGTAFDTVDQNGKHYLLDVLSEKAKIRVLADQENLTVKIDLDIYCRAVDKDSTTNEGMDYEQTTVPDSLKRSAERILSEQIYELFNVSKQTRCDFLRIKEKLYRYCFKQYSRYKDNFLDVCSLDVNVNVNGQR